MREIRRRTSWPSKSGFSTWALPPLSPKPRWSKERTPYPASSHFWKLAGSLVRDPPQPWLCMMNGTRLVLLAPAGRNSV